MDRDSVLRAYRRYAALYDVWFGAVLDGGRRAVIERLDCAAGERVLEVGVGTGLSLPYYPRGPQITGIDLSSEMLARAQRRKQMQRLDHVVALEVMDAECMRFADDSFDKVVALYVVSVVPDPVRVVQEMSRVCRPGGEIFIVNHFLSANALLRAMEHMLAPLSRSLGFRPDLALAQFERDAGLDVVERSRVNMLGYWTLLRARNDKRELRSGRSSESGAAGDWRDVPAADDAAAQALTASTRFMGGSGGFAHQPPELRWRADDIAGLSPGRSSALNRRGRVKGGGRQRSSF